MYWDDVLEEVEDEVKREFPEILSERYYQDRLNEIIDNAIPIYNSDLADLLSDNNDLAEVDDYGLIEGVTDVWKIIQMSIYEKLSSYAYEVYEEEKENWQECSECGEWIPLNETGLCESCEEKEEEEYEV